MMKTMLEPLFKILVSDYNQRISYTSNHRRIFSSTFLLVFIGIALMHNLHLFTTVIYENADFAANSILINSAKSLQLFVGNYSRMHFNHPGPAFLYIMAIFDKILFEGLHLVPSAFNAHVISIMFLNSFFLAICCYIFFDITNSIIKSLSIVGLILIFYSINPILFYSSWMPHVYFAPFFTFLLSALVVSLKKSSFLWVMILSGLFLIHGHVIFILFTCPISFISIILCLSKYKFNFSNFFQDNRFNIFICLLVITVFLLPIIFNTIINYPGEFGKYFNYSANNVQKDRDIISIMNFFLPFWLIFVRPGQILSKLPIQISDGYAGLISLLSLIFIIVLLYNFSREKCIKDIIVNTSIIVSTATILFLLYVSKGIDELIAKNHYTGIFFYTIPLLLLCIILIGILSITVNNKFIIVIFAISLICISVIFYSGNFTNPEKGSPYIQEAIIKLQSDPRWYNDTIVLDFEHEHWQEVIGIVVASERLGTPLYVKPRWKFMFTKNHIINQSQNISKKIWHISLIDNEYINGNVIYTNDKYSLMDRP